MPEEPPSGRRPVHRFAHAHVTEVRPRGLRPPRVPPARPADERGRPPKDATTAR